MDNPEEVLQALDEFQNMRPTEIPRKLEDYLCWVAKTGDPVYQWSLIKTLFREKLMRVMTEFYESCPTLDLTPCPNVEQFNYDIMKRNLLERLESFANAPFTVQRICELLTTPRKEYNRIDKFMRAIEKNILVVSTKEPGPYGRRSENGDNLVNGSMEVENSPPAQASNDVDMENWVKDCTIAAAVPVQTGDGEDMSIDNGLNHSSVSTFNKNEKMEFQSTADNTAASSFVNSSSEYSETTTAAVAETPVQEPTVAGQNLTTANHEAPVPGEEDTDVIMNEDTSSQPSLDLENDDNECSDSKKLRTTFQPKDFSLDEVKPEDSIETADKPRKECDSIIQSTCANETLTENKDDLHNSEKIDNLDSHSIVSEANDQGDKKPSTESELSEKSESDTAVCADNISITNNSLDAKKDENIEDLVAASDEKISESNVKEESKVESVIQENTSILTEASENITEELPKETEPEAEIKVNNPIVEEPISETSESISSEKTESLELTAEEMSEEDSSAPKAVPDPIPIIEEPKEADASEQVAKDSESPISVSEATPESQDESTSKNGLEESLAKPDQTEGESKSVVTSCEEMPSNKTETDETMEQEKVEAIDS